MSIATPEPLLRALAILCMAVPLAAHADTRIHLGIASSYVHRGLQQTLDDPAIHASVEYRHGGWFAGLWASTVDFGTYDERRGEVDYYLGYGKRLSPALALEATGVRYTYLGSSPRQDDWSELQLTAYVGDRWTFTWGIADHWWATSEPSRFLEGTYRHPLPAELVLDVTAGYQLAERAAGIDYGYADAGVSRRFGELVLRAGYAAVASDAGERFGPFAGNQWIASLTWQP